MGHYTQLNDWPLWQAVHCLSNLLWFVFITRRLQSGTADCTGSFHLYVSCLGNHADSTTFWLLRAISQNSRYDVCLVESQCPFAIMDPKHVLLPIDLYVAAKRGFPTITCPCLRVRYNWQFCIWSVGLDLQAYCGKCVVTKQSTEHNSPGTHSSAPQYPPGSWQ